MNKGPLPRNINTGLVALLLLGVAYLSLILYLGTSSPFVLVRGSSMEPTLHNGDLLLSRKVTAVDVRVGQLIVFRVPADARERLGMPPYAVHRITRIDGDEGQLLFVTQGDNSGQDPFKVHAGEIKGRIVKNLGPIGRPFGFLTNKSALLLLGLPVLAFVLIIVTTLRLLPSERREPVPNAVAGSSAQFDSALNRLADAIAEYGTHLQSHTTVVKNLGETSGELKQVVMNAGGTSEELKQVVMNAGGTSEELKQVVMNVGRTSEGLEQAVREQNSVLTALTAAVGDLKRQASRGSAGKARSGAENGKASGASSAQALRKANKKVKAAPD